MVASAVFITDLQGKPLISRDYRGDVPLSKALDRFGKLLSEVPQPVFYVDRTGQVLAEDDVVGTGGETFVYIAVSDY